jgi:mRNA-degrading endonuclease RelE of RelBE toxin-antitoxin system
MVICDYSPQFAELFKKIKDGSLKEKVKKQIIKIVDDPNIGKPMKYGRKGTREAYVKPFRLSYLYIKERGLIVLLDLYHKDKQ